MNIATLPKVLLHDHLDGGLRPQTVVELASEFGYAGLPTTDVADLATWFNRGAKRNDLVLYLETFAHTVGVMQHRAKVIGGELTVMSKRSEGVTVACRLPIK